MIQSQKNHNNAAIMKNSERKAKGYTPAARAARYSNVKMQQSKDKNLEHGTRNTGRENIWKEKQKWISRLKKMDVNSLVGLVY